MSDAPRKRRWRRWLAVSALVVSVGLLVALIAVRLYYNDKRLTALIQREVAANVPFPVTIGNVHLSLLSGVVVTGIRVGPPTAAYKDDVLSIAEVGLHYALAPLLQRRLDVRSITVTQPHATLEMVNGEWNAVAMGKAFPPSEAKPEPASQPASELPVSITLEHFAVTGIVADVHAPDMQAHLDGVALSASGALAGKGGNGAAEVHADGAFAFAQRGLGDAAGHLGMLLEVKAPSFTEAAVNWSIDVTGLRGTMAGAALPALPVSLRGTATANMLTQTAVVERCEVALGTALSLSAKLTAHEILGDPLLDVSAVSVRADLAPLLALAPPGRVPLKANGVVTVEAAAHGRLSALQARRDVTSDITVRWHDLSAVHAKGTLGATTGELSVAVHDAISVALESRSATAGSDAGSATDVELHADVTAPLSLLAQKLDSPLAAALRMHVGAADAAGVHAQDVSLTAHAQVFDLAGAHAKAGLVLDVAQARVAAAGGTVTTPVHVDLAAERRGTVVTIEHLLAALGELVTLQVSGTANTQGPAVDVHATVGEMDLARVLAIVPPSARPAGLSLKGKLAAEMAVKGVIPKDLAAQLQADPETLLVRATPFDLSLAVKWDEIAVVQPGTHVAGACGSLRVKTGPKSAAVRLDGDVGLVEVADSTLDNVRYAVALDDRAGELGLTLHTAIGAVHRPDVLAKPLDDVMLDTAVTVSHDAEIKSFSLTAPSLGMKLTLHGLLQRADTFLREKQWQDPALPGVHASLGMHFELTAPGTLQPLAGNALSLAGGVALDADAAIADSTASVSGSLALQKLSVVNGEAAVTRASGAMPFTQRVKLGTWKPMLSDVDIFKQKPRIAYYDDLRSYGRDAHGLTIEQLKSGRFAIDRISFNGHIADGMLLIDHFGASLLTGDVAGELAVQLGADKTARLALRSTFSNVDLSVLGKTKPGPNSQVNGNTALEISWGERVHNVDGAFNLTRLGRELLVEALRALDPEDKDAKMRANRQALQRYQITIDLLDVWIKNNNVNADLFYSLILTKLTLGLYKPINNDLVRRLNISPRLDALAPTIDPLLGPYLGWSKARSGAAK